MATEKQPNYTTEQEQLLRDSQPLNLEKARELATEIGKSWQSIVAKALSMDLEYEVQEKPKKRQSKVTKKDLVREIEDTLVTHENHLNGLEKATTRALVNLRKSINNAI